MRERITASPISGLSAVSFGVVSEQPFWNGGIEKKNYLRGNTGVSERSRSVRLVERRTGNASTYIEKWQMLKDAGLPVVPTLRMSSRGTLLLTDLTHDGSDLYGKGKWLEMKGGVYSYDAAREVDSEFLRITDHENISEVIAEADYLSEYATQSDILLPYDDPCELIVSPDGDWRLCIIDVAYAKKNNTLHSMSGISDRNNEFVTRFITHLTEINHMLSAVRYDAEHGTTTASDVVRAIRTRFMRGDAS